MSDLREINDVKDMDRPTVVRFEELTEGDTKWGLRTAVPAIVPPMSGQVFASPKKCTGLRRSYRYGWARRSRREMNKWKE